MLSTVDPELGADIAAHLTQHTVDVRTNTRVDRIVEKDGRLHVVGDHGFEQAADLVLVVTSVRPDVELARTAGVELGERGAIRVDRAMRSNIPHLYAAGDCVQTWHHLTQQYTCMPLGTTSHKQGRVAGAEVSKRVDIYATVIYNHMTIEALADLDLAYTPPLSSPWDPTQMAALAWELEPRAADERRSRSPKRSCHPAREPVRHWFDPSAPRR